MAIQKRLAMVATAFGHDQRGVAHWWVQRATAVLLIPGVIWFVMGVMCLVSADYHRALRWFSSPLNAGVFLLFLLVFLAHGLLGMQVVIEDYISDLKRRGMVLRMVRVATVLVGLLAVAALARIMWGA